VDKSEFMTIKIEIEAGKPELEVSHPEL